MKFIILALGLIGMVLADDPTLILYSDDACTTELATYGCSDNFNECNTPQPGKMFGVLKTHLQLLTSSLHRSLELSNNK
jgi:hypothetical protein